MATTIVTKNGSGAPTASDLVAGELAVDLTNKRLYTEDSGGTVIEVGSNPYNFTANHNGSAKLATTATGLDVTGTVTADGLTVDGTGQITRLGLGVAAHASAALNITTAGTDQNIRLNNGSELGVIDLDSSGHLNIWAHGDGETINLKTGSGSGNNVVSVVGNNVGIGTSSPNNKMSITGFDEMTLGFPAVSGGASRSGIKPTVTGAGAGQIQFLVGGDNNTEATTVGMMLDASGNVGIGTSSPLAALDVTGTDAVGTLTSLADTVTRAATIIRGSTHANGYGLYIGYGNSSTDAQYIQSTIKTGAQPYPLLLNPYGGNVGIGTNSPNYPLTIGDGTDSLETVNIVSTDAGSSRIFFSDASNVGHGRVVYDHSDNHLEIYTSDTEAMRIDASGNLLVAGTNTNPVGNNVVGHALTSDGRVQHSTTGDTVLKTNQTTDGNIAQFRVAGAPVGSIGVQYSDIIYISDANNSGLAFDGTATRIFPCNSDGTVSDADTDLGSSGGRFQDLYLSGGLRGDTTFKNNAGTTEYARFDASGNLLVGKSVTALATAGHTFGNDGYVYHTRNGDIMWLNQLASSGSAITFMQNSGVVGTVSVTTTATAYNTSSDQRLKENIADADDAGSKIDAIQVRKFDWKADGSHQDYGMVAQELLDVAPEAVSAPEDPEEMMGVDYSKLVPMLVKEIRSLRARVAQLES